MKTLRCPVCGVPLKPIRGYDVHGITTDWVAGCYNCFFQSSHFWKTKKACIEDMDRLVSLFPPIMRVWPGDRLAYDGWVCVVTSIDREKCTIDVVSTNPAEPFDPGIEDFTPPIDGAEITPDFVDAWPWELKQKGGSND